MRIIGRLFILVVLCIYGAGCSLGKWFPWFKHDTKIDITISAASNLNIDRAGNSNPVFVNILYVKSVGSFNNQDNYVALFYHPEKVLGNQLLFAKEPVVLEPGTVHKEQIIPPDGAKYLGIVAGIKNYRDNPPLKTVPIIEGKKQCLSINVDGNYLSISSKCE